MPDNKSARLFAYVTGLVNQKLLLQNEAAENRILRAHLPARMRLSDPERSTVPIANPVCRRIRTGGDGSGFEGMWQVGFESAAACFAPLPAPPDLPLASARRLGDQAGRRRGRTCLREGLGWSLTKFRLRAARTGGEGRQPAVWQRQLPVPPAARAAVPACL
jgi:hypothetical protein